MIKNSLGYSIEQHGNDICIHLPPTPETITNTLEPVRDRKKSLSPSELAGILIITTYLLEPKGEDK